MYSWDLFHIYTWERAQRNVWKRQDPFRGENKTLNVGQTFCPSYLKERFPIGKDL